MSDTIHASVGDTLVIKLEARYTQGLVWSFKNNSDTTMVVKQAETSIYKSEQYLDFIEFSFVFSKPGVYSRSFEHKRPFDKIQPPVDSCKKIFIIKS